MYKHVQWKIAQKIAVYKKEIFLIILKNVIAQPPTVLWHYSRIGGKPILSLLTFKDASIIFQALERCMILRPPPGKRSFRAS